MSSKSLQSFRNHLSQFSEYFWDKFKSLEASNSLETQLQRLKECQKSKQFSKLFVKNLIDLKTKSEGKDPRDETNTELQIQKHRKKLICEHLASKGETQNNTTTNNEQEKNLSIHCIDNLLKLIKAGVDAQTIKMQIKRQSIKQMISYNKVLIAIGVQKLIQMFNDDHDTNMEIDFIYLTEKMGQNLAKFQSYIEINDWKIFKKIAQVAISRFEQRCQNKSQPLEIFFQSQKFDDWVFNQLRRNKQVIGQQKLRNLINSKKALHQTKMNITKQSQSCQQIPKGQFFYNFRKYLTDQHFSQSSDEQVYAIDNPQATKKLQYFQEEMKKRLHQDKNTKNQKISKNKLPLIQFQININKDKLPDRTQIHKSFQQIEELSILGEEAKLPISKREKILIKQRKIRENKKWNKKINVSEDLAKEINTQFLRISSEKLKGVIEKYLIQPQQIILPQGNSKDGERNIQYTEFDPLKMIKEQKMQLAKLSVIQLESDHQQSEEHQIHVVNNYVIHHPQIITTDQNKMKMGKQSMNWVKGTVEKKQTDKPFYFQISNTDKIIRRQAQHQEHWKPKIIQFESRKKNKKMIAVEEDLKDMEAAIKELMRVEKRGTLEMLRSQVCLQLEKLGINPQVHEQMWEKFKKANLQKS